MKLSDFNFKIPESLLAQYPNENRDESRLLVLDKKNGDIQHLSFKDVINFFDEEDVLVCRAEYLRLAQTLWNGTEPQTPAPLPDREIFELLGFD